MAYANSAVVSHNLHQIQTIQTKTETKAGHGLMRRLFEAMMESRKRQADREIISYLAMRSFNDEFEREIERRVLSFPPYR